MWKLTQGELNLKQTFQMISGTLRNGNVTTPISGKLNGDQISFTAGARSIYRPCKWQRYRGNRKRRK